MNKKIKIISDLLSEESFVLDKKKKITNKCIIFLIGVIFYLFFITYFLLNTANELKILNKDIIDKQIENDFLKYELEKIKKQKIDLINSYDLENDDSLTKFVNSSISFNDKEYIPENLKKIASNYIYDSKWWRQLLRGDANDALQKLWEAFLYKFNRRLTVVSAYRSYMYQKWIKIRGCPDNLCAKAGYSEHQSGLAVDLWETTTNEQFLAKDNLKKYFNWLNENAYKYGFHNTYQKWLEIDGYEIEPWHWRYMWVEFATYLKENSITIAEFYNNK